MPDFSAVRGHYSAIIQGQLIQVFLGKGKANDSDVSTKANSLFKSLACPASLLLLHSPSIPFSRSLLYFPCLVYSSFAEPIFTPLPKGHIQIQSCNWVSPLRPDCLALC